MLYWDPASLEPRATDTTLLAARLKLAQKKAAAALTVSAALSPTAEPAVPASTATALSAMIGVPPTSVVPEQQSVSVRATAIAPVGGDGTVVATTVTAKDGEIDVTSKTVKPGGELIVTPAVGPKKAAEGVATPATADADFMVRVDWSFPVMLKCCSNTPAFCVPCAHDRLTLRSSHWIVTRSIRWHRSLMRFSVAFAEHSCCWKWC